MTELSQDTNIKNRQTGEIARVPLVGGSKVVLCIWARTFQNKSTQDGSDLQISDEV